MVLPYRILKNTQHALVMLACLFLSTAAWAAPYQGASIGTLKTTTIQKGELLMDVAEKYQIGYAQLLAANPTIDPWLPRPGTKVILPDWHLLPNTVHEGLVLNTGELRLYYYPPGGAKPLTFPIGIGREGLNTPMGTTTIVAKKKDPEWRPTPRMRQEDPELPEVVRAGKDNPLGAYALYLGWPSYRIHGTNKPKAIGRRASSGCVRMYEGQIQWMFENVPVGTKLTSINQPVKMARIDGQIYIEAEPNDIQIDELEYKNRQVTVDIQDGVIGKIREFAGPDIQRIDWVKVRNTLIERNGIPTNITMGGKTYYPIRAATKDDENPLMSEHEDRSHLMAKPLLDREAQGTAVDVREADVENVKQSRRTDWDNLNGM